MADLPDLDTSNILYIAYWNIRDQGGDSEWSVADSLTAQSVIQYTLYDNGVDGTLTLNNGRVAQFRMKDDGWLIVYIDRTQNYGDSGAPRGAQDLIGQWTDNDTNGRGVQNALERAINELRSESDAVDNHGYSPGDVGLYNYEDASATTVTVGSRVSTGTAEHLVETGTTVYRGIAYAACGSRHEGRGNFNWNNGAWDPGEYNTGTRDLVQTNEVSEGSSYQMDVESSYGSSYYHNGGFQIVWS